MKAFFKAQKGTLLSVRVFQILSLIPLVYAFAVSGYPSLITRHSVLSFLFDVGVYALPCAEAWGLSALYRVSMSDMLVCFLPAVAALLWGIFAQRVLLNGARRGRITRVTLAIWIGADLILRLMPISFHRVFSLPVLLTAFGVRLVCLMLILCDLIACRREQ